MNSLSETERTRWHQRAHNLIPAGAHTYSRADNQFPQNAPAFVERAWGCRFRDERGQDYLDYGMGLLSVTLGHAHEEVNEAVLDAVGRGTCYSRPSLLEGELAELLNRIIPSAQMVKFAKNGSDVTAAAVRLARHYTGRDLVVRCRQHPFHSLGDWFIGSTSRPGGVPDAVRRLVLRFDYNDIDSLQVLFHEHPGQIACVIMEPMTGTPPLPGFLQAVKDACESAGALLIFDEIITGFRLAPAGGQKVFGVTPHLSTFGKGIANGFPLSVLCGLEDVMRHGGMDGAVFLLSGTYGGETVGLAAALATVRIHLRDDVTGAIAAFGGQLLAGFQTVLAATGLEEVIALSGHPARPELRFVEGGTPSPRLKTFFMQEMLESGVFLERIGISASHDAAALAQTLPALEKACVKIAAARAAGKVNEAIRGPLVQPVFTF